MLQRCFIIFLISLAVGEQTHAQCISSFPFSEDFETGNGNWQPAGTNADWSWGTPLKGTISTAGNGTKCWIAGTLSSSAYAGSQKSWIESPCFDFSALQFPWLSFLIFWDTERQYDGGNLQYSLNNGTTWQNLGSVNTTVDCLNKNWFNENSITNLSGIANPREGWSGTTQPGGGSCLGGGGSGQWKEASVCMKFLSGEPSVRFRFTFCSGSTCNNYDGIAIDAFSIAEAPVPVPQISVTCLPGNAISVSGTSTWCPQQWSWDFGVLPQTGDTSALQNAQFIYGNAGSYTITLVTRHECSPSGSLSATVNFPEAVMDITPVTCENLQNGQVVINVTGVTNPVITWNTNPPVQGNSISNLPPGTLSLSITSDDGCAIDTTSEILYGPDAFPMVDLGLNRYICANENLILNPGPFASYLWQDNSSDSLFLVSQPGTYSVAVMNDAGCEADDTVEVIYACPDAVWIPNAFTPGQDGLNDSFLPRSSVFESGSLWIFNRLGQTVFETEDMSRGWDGTLNGEPCQEGVYFYRFRYRIPGDKVREKSGLLTLLR